MNEAEQTQSDEVREEMDAAEVPTPDFLTNDQRESLWNVLFRESVLSSIVKTEVKAVKHGEKWDIFDTVNGQYFAASGEVKTTKIPCEVIFAFHLEKGAKTFGRVIKRYIEL